MMLEKEMKSNSKNFLVHLYRSTLDNTFMVLAHEPVSGSVFKLEGNDQLIYPQYDDTDFP